MTAQAAYPVTEERSVVPLRAYQQQAHDAVWAAFDRGVKRQLVSIATGGGKTILASHIIRKARAQGFGNALFMVHRDELVRQSVDALRKVNPSLSIGVVKAERNELHADIVVASAQTLAVRSRLDRVAAAVDGKLLFISDECHHDLADSRRRAIDTLNPALLVGLTATPKRGDKAGLDAVYQEIVFHLSMLELIAMGKLAKLKGLRIDTEADLDAVHTRGGEFAENELEDAIDTSARNSLIVEAYQRHASDRKKTVAFCVTVAHANHLVTAFREAGIRAEGIFGPTPSDERQRLLAEFKAGDIPVLVNVMVLSEGYDEPGIDCVLWTRPTKSQALYVQCIGRAARMAEDDGKKDALIIDFVDSSSRHKLISLPSLAGEEVTEQEPRGDSRKQGELFDLLEFAQSKTKLRESAAVAVNLFAGSDYVWRTVDGYHMAPAGKNRWLTLRPVDDGFVPCSVDEEAGLTPLFDRALDVETAMGVAESRMEANALTAKGAHWRVRAEPPSVAQIQYARRLRVHVPIDPYEAMAAGFTKARVAELIDEKAFARALRAALREAK